MEEIITNTYSIERMIYNMTNKIPSWLQKLENNVNLFKRILEDNTNKKQQREFANEFIETDNYKQLSVAEKEQVDKTVNYLNSKDWDKEIEKTKEAIIDCELKYKKGLINYKKWLLEKDFK